MPRLWGIMMFILGVIILIRGLGKMNGAKKGGYCPPKSGQLERLKKSVCMTAARAWSTDRNA